MKTMLQKKILVVGSANTDMVVRSPSLPKPGETILGGKFWMNPGGKGANQAVAAARLGGNVSIICKTGNDIFGKDSKLLFIKEGIDTSYLFSDDQHPSGIAFITVDDQGENCIVVASGANAYLTPAELQSVAEAIDMSDIILMQLEIPLDTVEYVVWEAFKKNKQVILNPAPGQLLSENILKHLYCITPNENETELITGLKVTDTDSAKTAAETLISKGVEIVIITLGAKGALIVTKNYAELIPAVKVKPVDTTAAGDVFNGAFAVAIAEGMSLSGAVKFACNAAAISVTRYGAQASAPYRTEMEE
jgi:ribokinase